MDWLTLTVLIPLILVPIVLLCGFAGCGLSAVGSLEVIPPTNLKATGIGTGQIDLSWQDATGGIARFRIERAPSGGSFAPIGEVNAKVLSFSDLTPGLVAGKTFLYQVLSIVGTVASTPSSQTAATTLPAAPTKLVATVVDDGHIDLAWQNNSVTATRFTVEFRVIPNAPAVPGQFTRVSAGGFSSFSHIGLSAGTRYEYRVIAVVENGFADNSPKEIESAPSGAVTATTRVWKVAYPPPPTAIPLTTNEGGWRGRCLVQRVDAAHLAASGTKVRVTLQGSTQGNLVLNTVSISRAAAAGTEPFDSATAPIALKLANSPTVSLAANTAQTLDIADFTLDETRDLILAFDVNNTQGNGNVRFANEPGQAAFFKDNAQQAMLANRTAPYQIVPNRVFLVERIDVLSDS